MKKNIFILLGVAIVGYFVYKKFFKSDDKNDGDKEEKSITPPSSSSGSSSSSSGSLACSNPSSYTSVSNNENLVLKKGDSGDIVKSAQALGNKVLTKLGKKKISEDGKFGCDTEKLFKAVIGKTSGTEKEMRKQVANKLAALSAMDWLR